MIALVKGLVFLIEIAAAGEALSLAYPDLCSTLGGTWANDSPTFYQAFSCSGISFR